MDIGFTSNHCVIRHLFFSTVEHSVQGVLAWRSTGFSLRIFLLILIAPPEVVEGHSRSCRFPVCLVSWRDLDTEVSLGHHGDGRDKKRVTLGAKASSSFSSQNLFSFHIAGFDFLALAGNTSRVALVISGFMGHEKNPA
ncbi:hypothetical protein BDP81DRAFT_509384 [Colletotrichum phormii]|uniref:Uncharacterized protein n=1 Tax=Colletotrichum phormii TaxID=359342 RepID=A0AAI9ZZ09_9PEZI|nr:uncharacterized protein BDP81DRAFT_509384 [Colletotrichum phormii]KAK1640410.1 hypothetical protein BDP81DRAFT_509384 [Colletotrichum phormii]